MPRGDIVKVGEVQGWMANSSQQTPQGSYIRCCCVDGGCCSPRGSPCLDAGDPGYVRLPGEKDIDGQPRVVGAAIDMDVDVLPAVERSDASPTS